MQFSKLLIAVSLCVVGFSVTADATNPLTSLNKWMEKSEKIMEDSESMGKPAWMNSAPTEDALRAAEKLRDRSEIIKKRIIAGDSPKDAVDHWANKTNKNLLAKKTEPVAGDTWKTESYIFVSQSMPTAEMKAAIEVSTETGAGLVFRGIKKGQAIDHVSRHIGELIRNKPELKPYVVINPNLFKIYNVESVPTSVVILNGKLIRATGTLSIDYLLQKLEEEKTGDLGLVGKTYEIVEPDLIDELKRRTALIDWDKEKEGAAGRFWTNSWPKFDIPVSKEYDAFLIDPTFTLAKDIIARGTVVARAGQKYNAQKILPMTQIVVFFDGTDKDQLKAVKSHIKTFNKPIESFILVTTEIDRNRGFDAMDDLKNFFGYPVKILEKGMVERFKVKAVPSFVSGSGDFYKVEQLAITRNNK